MTQNITFRAAGAQDARPLTELRVLMQKELKSLTDAEISLEAVEEIFAFFEKTQDSADHFHAIAEDGGRAIGAAGIVYYQKPPSLPGSSGWRGYVTNVYTRPEWRRQGVAQQLLKMVEAHARDRKADLLHLETEEDTRSLYEGIGYKAPSSVVLESRMTAARRKTGK